MSSNELLQAQQSPSWVVLVGIILTGLLTWWTQAWLYRRKHADEASVAQIGQHERLEIHRDELTFELLNNARAEMQSARVEVDELRDEVRKLRSLENHFYHFEQSLEHLEALLSADNDVARALAERNARAFLNRMRRLQEAKGAIANEVQRQASSVHLLGDDPVTKPKDNGNG